MSAKPDLMKETQTLHRMSLNQHARFATTAPSEASRENQSVSNSSTVLRCTLDVRNGSFATEMVKAEARTCPLRLR
jgi:hypothetical protein